MNFPITKAVLLLTLSIVGTNANQACFASRGDLIARTAPQQSAVRTYRVSGWQNELTAANPNLGNFYWEPLTKRIINTTRTTSKGATEAPTVVQPRAGHYQKPIHVALPATNDVQLQTDAIVEQPRTKYVEARLRSGQQPVLTYQNNQSWSNKRQSDAPTVVSFASKESVYGVLKTNSARPVR